VTTAPPEEEEEPDPAMVPKTMDLSGALQDVHDPSIIAAHGQYYLYSTGGGIQWRSSADLASWTYRGDVLGGVPAWAEGITEGDLWAPGVAYFNGRYHLYCSASTFGSSRSAIGLATSPTLSPDSASYGWTDQEKVTESVDSDPYNAIDPNTITDRPDANPNAIEAPYIIGRDGYYYLFVSWGSCCPDPDGSSDYNIRTGRSESVTGPYVDQDGTPMTDGGGTLVLESFGEWQGTGHNSVLQTDDETMLVYHAYNANDSNTPYLRISPLEWQNGWPTVPRTEQ